jgi:hypothetical protein
VTPEECHAKRNEFNAVARVAARVHDYALESRCRLMATNMLLMASDDPAKRARGQAAYDKNKFRFERDMSAEVMKSRAVLRSAG